MSAIAPAVSVVTIFLDADRFLQEAIDSVRAQTFTDWELLLVDDGSTDTSTEIARRAADADPARVRYVEHPGHVNRGMSASRNLGIASARSDILAFLDADDVYLPDRLEYQLTALRAHPDASAVYGPMTLWYSWDDDAVSQDGVRTPRVPIDVVIPPPTLSITYIRGRAAPPATCSVLVRRDAITRIGGFEDAFTGMYEDQVFFYKLTLAEPVTVVDRPLDLYRQHDRSTTAIALASGEWHRRDPNIARQRFDEWLLAYAYRATPYGRLVRRELRRSYLVDRWKRSRPRNLVRRVCRAVRWRLSRKPYHARMRRRT
jgi:glycosyltransferase involved in cell wall biosynthesis